MKWQRCKKLVFEILVCVYICFKIIFVGVPCWIIRNANEQKPVQQIVTYYLQNTSQLKEAIQSAEESLHEFLEETTELFTVLHSPEVERTKSVSEVFVLSDAPDNSDAVVHENSSVDQNVRLYLCTTI